MLFRQSFRLSRNLPFVIGFCERAPVCPVWRQLFNPSSSGDAVIPDFYPRDVMLARSLQQRRVRLSVRPSVTPGIVRKRCILDTKLLWDGNTKPYAGYRMVSLSMTLSDPWPGFQGHGSFKKRVSPKRRILQTQLLYRTLIGNHRQALDRQASLQVTTPLLLRKRCKLFASVARVCQRQLVFLVLASSGDQIWKSVSDVKLHQKLRNMAR